ncbi:MAG: hypothetical protein WAT20_10135 [Ferruginibacter sp.]|nr:hypothetical protein [Chitinophagaceae bacterium]
MKHIFALLILAFISFKCQVNAPDPVPLSPTVTTVAASSITANTALSGGNATTGAGPSISARGVCWGTAPNPDINGTHTVNGSGPGTFASPITGLTPNTTYYVRAYATNIVGTSYGNEISFTTTTSTTALPTVTTTSITSITTTTAASGGNVTADGGATVTARGICWSTAANPTIALTTKTTDGSGMGIFTSAITGLTAATTYHVRAYATNSVGTSYGGDSVFTTPPVSTIPTITTTAISAITNTTANSGGTISTDGGAAVTTRGVCWSTTTNPTIALSTKTIDGTGIGTFTSAITGLTAATTYHVRAYATNSVGTAYGSDVTFTTTSSTPDVYVAGYEFGGTEFVAKIWKNGVATSLTNGSFDARANSIFVSGADVYATGWEYNGTVNQAKLWKNGAPTTLVSTCSGDGWGVYVSGTDVYVGGKACTSASLTNQVVVWKNNVPSALSNSANIMDGRSVFVSGTDVYVAGWEEINSSIVISKVWKNGVETALNIGTVAFVHSVFVSGSDVYVAGQESNAPTYVAKIWKNGVAIPLTNGTNDAGAYAVYVSGTDVYAAGNEYNGTKYVAKVWKNGVAQSLTNGANDASANSVYVFGTDVYVCGYDGDVAKVWKNGVATSLTNGLNIADATGIFVK